MKYDWKNSHMSAREGIMKVREELQEITKENNNAYGISDSLNLHKNFSQS